MDAMQNDSANAAEAATETLTEPTSTESTSAESTSAESTPAESASAEQASAEEPAAEDAAERTSGDGAEKGAEPEAEPTSAAEVPQPRAAEPESGGGKGKKRKAAPKTKSAAGTKALVVFRDGKVHYADESVVVLDLDEAAHPDTDVHDVVDKLSELRDAAESAGRTEAVTLVAELIQNKALA